LLLREQFGAWYWQVTGWLFLLLLSGSLIFAVVVSQDRPAVLIALVPWLLLILLWLSFARWGTGWLQAWNAKRLDPNTAHPFEHVLAESGIQVHAHTTSTDLKWIGVYKVMEMPDLFLFYYNKRCAHYLPKRAIASAAELQAVRAFIRAHVPERAHLLEPAA
jgi:hypothetical protein